MYRKGDQYRQKALALAALANKQIEPGIRVEYENLLFLYMELAEEVEGFGRARAGADRRTASESSAGA